MKQRKVFSTNQAISREYNGHAFSGTLFQAVFLTALLGSHKSDLGKRLQCVWKGGKHVSASDFIHGSELELSKQQKTLYSCGFCWVLKGTMQIVTHHLFPPKLQFPRKSSHDIQNTKNVTNLLHGFHTTTVTNCQPVPSVYHTR